MMCEYNTIRSGDATAGRHRATYTNNNMVYINNNMASWHRAAYTNINAARRSASAVGPGTVQYTPPTTQPGAAPRTSKTIRLGAAP